MSIHYKYIVDKVRHMRKGKRFQKKYDLYVSHDKSKFSNSFAMMVKKSIRDFTPNIRTVLCTEYDAKKEDDPTPFKNMLGFYKSEKFSTGKY